MDITMHELECQSAELLPEKETLLLNTNWAQVLASNSATSLQVMTIGSASMAGAWQSVSVYQH